MSEFAAEPGTDGRGLLVSGELDIAVADEFLDKARAALGAAESVLEIEFSGVTFVDSTGLGALVRLREEALAAGKEVRLVNVPRQAARVLELTGLTDLFGELPDQ
jgi:anti-anti-sigma factor